MVTFRYLNFSSFFLQAVRNERPVALEVVETVEIVTVDDRNLSAVDAQGLNRLDGFLVFGESGSWGVIGETKAIHHKIGIVGIVTKISTICHVLFAIFILGSQAL